MGIDITGPEFLKHQVLKGSLGAEVSKVNHHRNVRQSTSFHAAFDRDPVGSTVVRHFDADDRVAIGHGQVSRGLCVHIVDVLFVGVARHACAEDVQENQHTGAGAVNYVLLELREVVTAGRSGVNHGGHAGAEGEGIGEDAPIAASEHAPIGAGENVSMKIDQAGSNVESSHIDHLARLCGGDIRGNGGDPAIPDREVAPSIDIVLAVDEVTALQQEVVRGLGEQSARVY